MNKLFFISHKSLHFSFFLPEILWYYNFYDRKSFINTLSWLHAGKMYINWDSSYFLISFRFYNHSALSIEIFFPGSSYHCDYYLYTMDPGNIDWYSTNFGVLLLNTHICNFLKTRLIQDEGGHDGFTDTSILNVTIWHSMGTKGWVVLCECKRNI